MKLESQFEGNKLSLSGNLDEEAHLPVLNAAPGAEIILDLSGIKSVNSVGIRTWLGWIGPLSEQVTFVFEKVPHAVVLQINMIEGFLPKTARVSSFYVPIYSEAEDEEDQILLTVGSDIIPNPNGPELKVDLQQIKGDGDWELDVVEKTYFKFLTQ